MAQDINNSIEEKHLDLKECAEVRIYNDICRKLHFL